MSYSQPPAYQPPSQPEYNAGGEPPLWAPWYGIGFGAAIRRFFKKYADFTGRASRGEYWWWTLAYAIVVIVLNIISRALGGGSMNADGSMASPTGGSVAISVIEGLFFLAIIVPTLAVTWRRLHDTNRSGAWWFLIFIPIVGGIIVLIFTILGPKPEGQRFDRPRA